MKGHEEKSTMNGHTPAGRAEQMDFEVFLTLLFLRKRLIGVCVIATVALAALASLMVPRRYEATAKILAEPARENNPYSVELRSQQERRMFLETQKELAVSFTVLRDTLAESLAKPFGLVKDDEVRQFERRVSVRSRSGMGANPFQGNGIGESSAFFLSVQAGSPEEARQVTDTLVKNYLKAASRVRAEQGRGATETLEAAVEETRQRTLEAHAKLAKFETETGSLLTELTVMDKPTLRVFPELEVIRRDYETAQAAIAQTEALVEVMNESLKAESGEPALPAEALAASPALSDLKTRIMDLRLQVSEKRPFFTDSAREMQSLHEQIKAAEGTLAQEIRKTVEGKRQSLEAMKRAQAQRKLTLEEYDKRAQRLSELNSQYAELRRQYQALASALNVQMESLAEARISAMARGANAVNVAVIDWAIANPRAVAPRFWRNLLLSLIVGLGLGVLLAIFSQLARPVFVHPRQLERATGLPVVAICQSPVAEGPILR